MCLIRQFNFKLLKKKKKCVDKTAEIVYAAIKK